MKEVWTEGGRVQQQTDEHPERIRFLQFAKDEFYRAGVEFDQVKTWVVLQKEEMGSGYIDGHPHTHEPPEGTTIVYYLTQGAPIVVEGTMIHPEPGLMVMFPNTTLHGVYKHKGEDRLALIATAI